MANLIIVLALLVVTAMAIPPKLRELVETGNTTREKQKNLTFSWKVLFGPGDGQGMEIESTESPELKRIGFYVVQNGERNSAGELYIQGNVWYSRNNFHGPGKYRPYEADLLLPSFYGLMTLAELQFADASQLDKGHVERETNGIVYARVKSGPEFENFKSQLQKSLELLGRDPALLKDQKVKIKYEQIGEVITNGLPFEIDAKSGVVTKFMFKPGQYATVRDINWSANPPKLPKRDWIDKTSTLTGVGTSEVVMMGHTAIPEKRDLDSYLLNLDTHEYRRVPSVAGVAMGGCFLPGRKSVLVHENDVVGGGFRPRLVNLETGESELFFPELFEGVRMTFGGSISPDGKFLAMVTMGSVMDLEEKQVVRIDLARRVLEKIGEPDDYSEVCWLPNGEELIVERIEPEERMDVPLRHAVCIMNLKGEVRKIADGENPNPLADGRILFQRPNYKWATITVDGKSEKAFEHPIPDRCGFAVMSPNRKEVLFLRFGESGPTGRLHLEPESGKTRIITSPLGAWTTPVW